MKQSFAAALTLVLLALAVFAGPSFALEIRPLICYERQYPPEGEGDVENFSSTEAGANDSKCVFSERFFFWNCSPEIPLLSLEWSVNGYAVSNESEFEYYFIEGTYTVTLTLKTEFGDFASSMDFTVVDAFPITADFDAEPASGIAPLDVTFTNQSSDYPWLFYWWDFGDGTTSDTRDARHTYEKPGNYHVCLDVMDLRDCKGLEKNGTYCMDINVTDPAAEYCPGNLLEDPVFDSGDLEQYWNDSPTSSPGTLLCSPETCDGELPYLGTYWVRFYDRFTDDVLAFGQAISIPDPGLYQLSYYYKASQEASGTVEVYFGGGLVDTLRLPEMHTGNIYTLRTVNISIADTAGEGEFLLEFVNPSLGNADVHIDAVCLRSISPPPVHTGDANGDWRITMGEAIACLAGWQQGTTPMAHAIRAAYLWQNGEAYAYDGGLEPPLCWILAP